MSNEIRLTRGCIMDCTGGGQDATESIEYWLKNSDLAAQLNDVPMLHKIAYLKGFGAWDNDELQDEHENDLRIIWTLCGQVRDEEYTKSFYVFMHRIPGKPYSSGNRYRYAYMDR